MSQLGFLDLSANQLANLTLPAGLTGLTQLELYANQLGSLTLPADMTNLIGLDLFFNQLTNLIIPPELRNLFALDLDGNQFTSFDVPPSLTRLGRLNLHGNQLTSLTLPAGLTNLNFLFLDDNQLTNVGFPPGLTKLSFLKVNGNQLTNLTLLPDMTNLTAIFLDENPLTAFVLPETFAATNLAGVVTSLQNQGIPVFAYPLTVQLSKLQPPLGVFRFGITGPPGIYTVSASTNLESWSALGAVNNTVGGVFFTDGTAQFSAQKFYRAQRLQNPPANMVFVPANTFMMGSPTNEVGHQSDESPQTLVTLSHGFWISKFLVTQGDYLAVTGSNPGQFPGDLNRPVESVSWFAASNYCALLTQQDLAAGRIPAGCHYRLPTEAEWECAARAGTSTRFYY
ncbi:MAG TPA: SUMF1/EgtB/PvdO family nonheme iron enzyme, partial [Candidatus Binatia bacterium]|nr:SUMF1/EgtB/PvdO family nonheme iron enzyme [Candidatus Binatia bacterium]